MAKMTLKEAVEHYKLDRRINWFSFYGNVVYSHRFSSPCYNCEGLGCRDFGYKGNRRDGCPIPALGKNGNPIEIKGKNFEYYNPKRKPKHMR